MLFAALGGTPAARGRALDLCRELIPAMGLRQRAGGRIAWCRPGPDAAGAGLHADLAARGRLELGAAAVGAAANTR